MSVSALRPDVMANIIISRVRVIYLYIIIILHDEFIEMIIYRRLFCYDTLLFCKRKIGV